MSSDPSKHSIKQNSGIRQVRYIDYTHGQLDIDVNRKSNEQERLLTIPRISRKGRIERYENHNTRSFTYLPSVLL